MQFRRQQALAQIQNQAGAINGEIDKIKQRIATVEGRIAATADPHKQSTLSAERDSLVARLGVLQQELQTIQPPGTVQNEGGEVIQPANLPSAPSSPSHVRDGLLGLFAGLTLGAGWAFVRERLDDRIRSQHELERRLEAPVLAAVSHIPAWRNDADAFSVLLRDPKSPAAEAYRTLRTNLQFLATKDPLRTLVVTSPTAGDGKTATAANLAVAMAQAGRKVFVISADLRRPRLHRFLGVPNEVGLSTLLADSSPVSSVSKDAGVKNLRIIPSGPVPSNPAELLQGERMANVLQQLREFADVIIIDTPPVLAVADASILAALADGTLVVVNAASASRTTASQARRQLENAGARIIGSVLNNYDPTSSDYYAYYYYYYQYTDRPDVEQAAALNGKGRGRKSRRRHRAKAERPAGFEARSPDAEGDH
ncbi:MAG: polysaccharide biosynthesis tyrosine autokinase [Actinomycetota bacterium]|nr:polysaccharide biosynthesis tyrosine autokinase [Actinomycetota bacterium]